MTTPFPHPFREWWTPAPKCRSQGRYSTARRSSPPLGDSLRGFFLARWCPTLVCCCFRGFFPGFAGRWFTARRLSVGRLAFWIAFLGILHAHLGVTDDLVADPVAGADDRRNRRHVDVCR